MILTQQLCLVLAAAGVVSGRWTHQESVVRHASQRPRSLAATNATAPIVDLGYAKYQGFYNTTFNNSVVYKGSVMFSWFTRRYAQDAG